MNNKRVFLGGTCNNSKWRDLLIYLLKSDNYFNPVVSTWDEEAKLIEDYEKKNCEYSLYVITPKMTGVYSIAEVVDDSNKKPDKTILCILLEDEGKVFDLHQLNSLNSVKTMVSNNGAHVFDSLLEVANFLNEQQLNNSIK